MLVCTLFITATCAVGAAATTTREPACCHNISTSAGGWIDHAQRLRGLHLEVTGFEWGMYSGKDTTGETWHGYDLEIFYEVARRGGFTVNINDAMQYKV